MHSSYTFTVGSAVFDEPNLVSAAGLVPVLELAEQNGLSELVGEHVELPSTRVTSGAANPAGKLTSIIAGMMGGADSIDTVNLLRAGGTPRVFGEVYAPSTLGMSLREFSFGHANQLAAVAREHLAALARRVALLTGIEHLGFRLHFPALGSLGAGHPAALRNILRGCVFLAAAIDCREIGRQRQSGTRTYRGRRCIPGTPR